MKESRKALFISCTCSADLGQLRVGTPTRMESLTVFLVLGLLAQPVLCQQVNPAMLALLSSGGAGGASRGFNPMALGMAGAEMGGNMQDMMLMQALSSGQGGGGSAGGMDPMTMMMLSGGGGAAAPSSDMMQQMMMMNMFRGGNQGGGSPQVSPQQQQQNMISRIGTALAGAAGPSGIGISGRQQTALWSMVSMSGNTQRIMDAISSPTDRIPLERDGLTGVNPMMSMTMCPRPTQCPMAFCENPELPYTGDSFYICRGCPRCQMDASQRNMMNMMRQMGGGATTGGAAPNMGMLMMLMRAMGQGGGGGGTAGAMNPAMMMALMNMQQQQQQQQQPSAQTSMTVTIPAADQRRIAPISIATIPASTQNQIPPAAIPPVQTHGPRPPPAFIAAMRAMSAQMKAQTTGVQPTPKL